MCPHDPPITDPATLLRLAQRCARQVSFLWTLDDDRVHFFGEAQAFLAPGLLEGVRTGADMVARVDPADLAAFRAAVIATLKAGLHGGISGIGAHEALVRVRATDQRWHWMTLRGSVTQLGDDGRARCVAGVLVDETDRETERREALRMRDLYSMLSAVNRVLSKTADRHSLLTELCAVAVTHGRFALAWVGLLDAMAQTVHAYAQAGETPTAARGPGGLARSDTLGLGRLTQAVLASHAPQTYNDLGDLQTSPFDWLPSALEAGYRSMGCFPLYEQGELIGGLVLCSREAQHFDAAMTGLLQGLGEDVSNALGHLLTKQQQEHTDRQLHEANRQFQTAMNAALDGILVVAHDGSIVDMNPAARHLLACHAPQAGGHDLLRDFTPGRYRAARRAQIQLLLNPAPQDRDTQRRIETYACKLDGNEVPVELVLTPMATGQDGLLMVTMRDLTTMHKQRDQLIESARRFEQLIEHSPDGMLVHVDGRIVLMNSRLRAMLGARHAQHLLGTQVQSLLHPDQGRWPDSDSPEALAEPGAPLKTEVTLRRLDGSDIEVDLLSTDTEFQGLPARQVVLRDIGERKRLERLRASKQAVLSLIAAHEPLETVLLEVARAVERNAPGVKCCVYAADESGTRFAAGYSPSVPVPTSLMVPIDSEPGDTPSVTTRAALTRLPAIVTDVELDSVTPELRATRRAMGARAVGAWPLLSQSGLLLGVIYVALPKVGEPDAHVMQVLSEYSDLTAVAIDNDRQAARIRHLAQHDGLTNLPNRAMFKQLLDHAIDRARRRDAMIATMFIDLDRFKVINDTFGHGAGDAVLCNAATRIKDAVRECDRVARMGGDEFIVLLDDLGSAEAAADIAQRILGALALPVAVGEQDHELSASIGIAVFPRDGGDSDTLLKHADIAMYRAKHAGRNGYSFFAEADNEHTTERFALQGQLRRALQRREFVLAYQPRVDLHTGRIRGVEALVRWQHPQRGLVMPGHFIEVAEETGLIAGLGRQVMEMAFADVPRLMAAGGSRMTVAINLSAVQIGNEGFVDEVRRLVARTGVAPQSIEFEITESVLMRQPEQARAVIETLRQMGFSFSLDDFGTGYSSLTYLKRFPVQCVKIDRSFVKDIPGDASDLAISRAIIAMAHSLSLGVVAEGVETPEQLEALRLMDCDQFQGYYFSKPVPIEQVLALMATPVPA